MVILKIFDKKLRFFLIIKHSNYNVVNCLYWDSNPGPFHFLCLILFFLNVERFIIRARYDRQIKKTKLIKNEHDI